MLPSLNEQTSDRDLCELVLGVIELHGALGAVRGESSHTDKHHTDGLREIKMSYRSESTVTSVVTSNK